ncbi:MAG: hypothetical protein M3M94_06845 [Actinomycetota bacterium]|nr:hypothetical protein [Actinomycetota bacterium]
MRTDVAPDFVPALVFSVVAAGVAVYGVSLLGIETVGDVLVILAFGLPGFVLGAVSGALLARRRWGVLIAQALGVVAGLGYYLLMLVTSDENDPCHDCGEILGVYTHPATFLFLGMCVAEWVVSALLAAYAVRARRNRAGASTA